MLQQIGNYIFIAYRETCKSLILFAKLRSFLNFN